MAMDCETCNHLLATYRSSVSLFKDAVRKGSRAVGTDFRLTAEQAVRLSQQCKEAQAVLMAHWRKDHGDFNRKQPLHRAHPIFFPVVLPFA